MILSYLDENNQIQECTITEAIQTSCSGEIEGFGVLETISENLNQVGRCLGILIEHLYENGLIDKSVLLDHILQEEYEEVNKGLDSTDT
jgi:hypothetical protein